MNWSRRPRWSCTKSGSSEGGVAKRVAVDPLMQTQTLFPADGKRNVMDRIDRYHGSLLGLAAGDALGTLEFRRPGTFEPVTGMVGDGPFGLEHVE